MAAPRVRALSSMKPCRPSFSNFHAMDGRLLTRIPFCGSQTSRHLKSFTFFAGSHLPFRALAKGEALVKWLIRHGCYRALAARELEPGSGARTHHLGFPRFPIH